MRGRDEINAAYDRACGDRPGLDDSTEATDRLDLDGAALYAAAVENADGGSVPIARKMLATGVAPETVVRAVAAGAFLCGVMTGVELERGET